MEKRKEKLKAIIAKAREELGEIEDAEQEKISAALVGKCFRYRNCYSCPEKPEDYWWVYRKIIGYDCSTVVCFDFQTDSSGKVEIDAENRVSNTMSGWVEIQPSKFTSEWGKLVSLLSKI